MASYLKRVQPVILFLRNVCSKAQENYGVRCALEIHQQPKKMCIFWLDDGIQADTTRISLILAVRQYFRLPSCALRENRGSTSKTATLTCSKIQTTMTM
jgi:hypothetical protein